MEVALLNLHSWSEPRWSLKVAPLPSANQPMASGNGLLSFTKGCLSRTGWSWNWIQQVWQSDPSTEPPARQVCQVLSQKSTNRLSLPTILACLGLRYHLDLDLDVSKSGYIFHLLPQWLDFAFRFLGQEDPDWGRHKFTRRNLGWKWQSCIWNQWSWPQELFWYQYASRKSIVLCTATGEEKPFQLLGCSKEFLSAGWAVVYIQSWWSFLGFFYPIYFSLISCWPQGTTKKKVAPYQWWHADLKAVKAFVKHEIDMGRYTPSFPVDFWSFHL